MLNIDLIKDKVPHFGKTEKGLFTFKELENLLNLRPFCNTGRLKTTNNKMYEMRPYSWNNNPNENNWAAYTIKEMLKNSSIYLSDCSKASKKINNYSKKLENIFNNPVDCHIYFSVIKNAEGFGKHRDVSQNVIVVCEGSINFKIYYNNKVLERDLSKGDYAYIPDNIYHHLTPISKKRLSCSFPVSHHKNDPLFDNREWLTL